MIGIGKVLRTAVVVLFVLLAGPQIIAAAWPDTPLIATVPAADRPPAQPGLPWLTVSGARIVDDEGRAVLLRGFDESALMKDLSHPATPFDAQDVRLMQKAGMSVVRLAIDWYHIEPVRGQIDQSYLDRVQKAVELFNQHGMYVVLDMHFLLNWSSKFLGAGAPDWASVPGMPDIQAGPSSFRADYSPAVIAAQTYFWLSSDWQRDFFLAWEAVAQRFRDSSGVAGYDIYNEPHPFPLPPNLYEKVWMWPLYQHSIEAIATVDPNHLFFAEGTLWFGLPVGMDHLKARDLVYSPHFYDGSIIPPSYSGDNSAIRNGAQQNLSEAKVLGAPTWVGETGIDHRQPLATKWTDALLDQYDQVGVGWGWWQWRQDQGWGIRNLAGDHLDLGFLRHLARPFMVFAPSGVKAGAADGVHGSLTIQVATTHGAGTIEVAWSTLTLSTPRVDGSCIRQSSWDGAAARLTLTLEPGAGCRITLTNGG